MITNIRHRLPRPRLVSQRRTRKWFAATIAFWAGLSWSTQATPIPQDDGGEAYRKAQFELYATLLRVKLSLQRLSEEDAGRSVRLRIDRDRRYQETPE
jgi:hypothetical protein